MERNWTKRKLLGLYQGDTETVRQWQSQYGRFIYTWLYYQLNKDESQAAALTAQTLSQALNELSAFDPEQTTMYIWLKDAASRQLQTVLSQSGLKVQRPGAWSEIPAKILDSLKRIRNEALIPDISGCGAVTEMVQSVLADLSEQDRDLLIRRYTRLDTVENIAADAGLSAEKVNQQLYLARHAFRRGLFFLMQSAIPTLSNRLYPERQNCSKAILKLSFVRLTPPRRCLPPAANRLSVRYSGPPRRLRRTRVCLSLQPPITKY
jgi:DNA-directed RNA polymerase specialized sigma24 family protein